MQKVLILFILIGFNVAAHSQTIAVPATPVTDSVRAEINISTKVKNVKGIVMRANQDIVQNLTNAPQFTIVLKAIRSAGLTGTFKSKGPITFFAPDDDAFKKLPKGRLDTLMKQAHNLELCNLITCHAIAGKITTKKIAKAIRAGKGTATFITIAGCKLTAKMYDEGNIMLIDENGNQSTIENADINQSNGLLHVINGILVPKNKGI